MDQDDQDQPGLGCQALRHPNDVAQLALQLAQGVLSLAEIRKMAVEFGF
jgi:hypothetical protein